MVETLIAMVLIAIWVLAVAGLQVGAIKLQKGAANRAVAVALASDLGERIDANVPAANAGAYALAATTAAISSGPDCAAAACSATDLAGYDLAQWTGLVAAALPMQQVSVVSAKGTGGLVSYTINIRWNEARGRQKYATSGTAEVLSHTLVKLVRHAGT